MRETIRNVVFSSFPHDIVPKCKKIQILINALLRYSNMRHYESKCEFLNARTVKAEKQMETHQE